MQEPVAKRPKSAKSAKPAKTTSHPAARSERAAAALGVDQERLRSATPPLNDDPIHGDADVHVAAMAREFPDLDIGPMSLAMRLRRIAALLDDGLVTLCEPTGVKLNEMLLLLVLRRRPGYSMRPTDILSLHNLTSGAITYRIDQLVKQTLVERVNDPGDRRGYLIRLSAHGRGIVDGVIVASAERYRRILAPLLGVDNAEQTLVELLRLYERCLARDLDSSSTDSK